MSKFLKVTILLFILVSCESDSYVEEVKEYREQKDRQFLVLESSPIPAFQKSYFKGLKYFEPNSKGIVQASFLAVESNDTIEFVVNETKTEQYITAGKVEFTLNNMKYSLTAFYGSSSNMNRLFVPFADLTSGVTTYGTGRYMYGLVENGIIELDFNYASNPYCAYNERYVCFPAPDENILDVKIEFGEKLYH